MEHTKHNTNSKNNCDLYLLTVTASVTIELTLQARPTASAVKASQQNEASSFSAVPKAAAAGEPNNCCRLSIGEQERERESNLDMSSISWLLVW